LIQLKNKNSYQKNIVKPEGLDLVVGRAVAYLGLIGFKVAGRSVIGSVGHAAILHNTSYS